MRDKLVTLSVFSTLGEAHIMKGVLTEHGIDSVITDDNIGSINLLFSKTLGGFRLIVHESDFERAKEIIEGNALLSSGEEETDEL